MRDLDGSPDGSSELIAVEGVNSGRKVVAGVEGAVSQKLEAVPMEVGASGLGDDIDDAARVLAVFGLIVAGLNTELLQSIGEREGLIDVGEFVVVIAAVEPVIGLVGARPVGGNGHDHRKCLGRP